MMNPLRYQSFSQSAWPPFNRLAHLNHELNQLLAISAPAADTQASSRLPTLDLFETEEAYRVDVAVPGLSAEQFEISFHQNVLTVSGKRVAAEDQAQGSTTRTERHTGNFSRRVEIPGRVKADAVSATYCDGVLSVTLPKAEDAKPRRINVSLN